MPQSAPQGQETAPWVDSNDGVHRILVIANETLRAEELIAELRGRTEQKRAKVRVVAPALVDSRFKHQAGAVDEGIAEAQERLEATLEELRSHGVDAEGSVGDADPMLALQDAVGIFPPDEVVISTHTPDRSRWLEQGFPDQARRELDVPVTHVVGASAGGDVRHLEPKAPEPREEATEKRRKARDIVGIVVAIAGTVVLWILAGAGVEGDMNGSEAARVLIAIGAFLISVWHVVGLMFFEATGYRGGGAAFAADLVLFGIPPAILVSALLL